MFRNLFWKERSEMMHPKLGRFMQRDPATFIDGPNDYEFNLSNPAKFLDPTGFAATTQPTPPVLGNQIGTVTTGPNSGSAVFPGVASDGSANGTWWTQVGGQWQQVPMNQIQSLPRQTYLPQANPPATQPSANAQQPSAQDEAKFELNVMRLWGNEFCENDKEWSWYNQCDDQAAALAAYLTNMQQGLPYKTPLWNITVVGGSVNGSSNHNVVLLSPISGNPLPPMVLDSFHGLMPWQNKMRICTLQTLQQFKTARPDPVVKGR
jgi:hypothetical protein